MNAYVPRRVLAVDVDGTLIVHGRVNASVLRELKAAHKSGYDIIVWSARGRQHAEQAAEAAGVTEISICIGKPSAIIDDLGWAWAKTVPVVRV